MNKYTRMNWENTPSTATPLTADNLNHMDEGIEQVTNGAIALETEVNQLKSNAEIDKTNLADVKSEITSARGEYDNLGQRLDTLISGNEQGQVDTFNLAEGAVTAEIIADRAITLSKLSIELLAMLNTINNKADKATTLAGYGITDAYTKTTVKTLLAGKLDAMSFDSEPTLNSPCYLTSGTVYSALTKKFDNSNIETGKGNLAPAQAIYDGYEGSFNYVKIGKIVTVALNITTLIAGKNYVQFAGLPYTALTASRLSSIAVYTTNNKLVNLRLDGSWLYVSNPGTTFADGEKINAIITYIIG